MDKIKNILGVKLFKIQKIFNPKGDLYKLIQIKKDNFNKFGECYISEIKFGKVKAWKQHQSQTQNIVVISGKLEIVLFDSRKGSKTFEKFNIFNLGIKNKHTKVQIPPLIWYGFKGLSKPKTTIINFTNKPHYLTKHKKLEIENNLINYSWKKKTK